MVELFVVRTGAGRERQVLDFLESKAKKEYGVYSIVAPQGMRGYILAEAADLKALQEVCRGVPYIRSVLQKPTSYEEIEHLIEFKPEQIDIKEGDIVRIVAGPFKGEKAKVTRLDKTKSEVVVELLEAAVPIPITINLDSVKVIEKEENGKD